MTMERREVFDVEDVTHIVLVSWDVDLVGIVVVACEYLEWAIGSWKELGLALLGKTILAEMYPN